jgi:hypothetical protein
MVGLVVLGLVAGGAGVLAVQNRANLVDRVTATSGPLAVAAQDLYRSLSDADATAASAFLGGGLEPAALRGRYQTDVASASAALATVAGGVTESTGRAAIQGISAQLPVYTGLVETARTYNRQRLPLGAAYLREASGLMRNTLLPAAEKLFQSVTGRLVTAADDAAGFPWIALPLGLLALAGLGYAQVRLKRRTNRVFNVGLVAATVAGLVSVLWLGVAWGAAAGHLDAARRDGTDSVNVLTRARIAALKARSDESLTLIARGSGKAFEDSWGARRADCSARPARRPRMRPPGAWSTPRSRTRGSGRPYTSRSANSTTAVNTALRSRSPSGPKTPVRAACSRGWMPGWPRRSRTVATGSAARRARPGAPCPVSRSASER